MKNQEFFWSKTNFGCLPTGLCGLLPVVPTLPLAHGIGTTCAYRLVLPYGIDLAEGTSPHHAPQKAPVVCSSYQDKWVPLVLPGLFMRNFPGFSVLNLFHKNSEFCKMKIQF